MKRALLAFCLIMPLGCSDPAAPGDIPVFLFVDQAAAAPGDTVVLRLVNASQGRVGYNLCSAVLERREPSGWRAAEPGRLCLSVQYGLEPRSQGSDVRVIPDGLVAGAYRFTMDVDWRAAPVPVTSRSFEVR